MKSYGDVKVIENLNIDITLNKTTALIGPSACGKTSLLNILSGLDDDYSGNIINMPSPVSYCFQEDRLLDWCSVGDNIKIVNEKVSSADYQDIVSILKLGNCLNRKVKTISGGQRQRTSIARAFCYKSEIIFLDEPFKSLDMTLKTEILRDINILSGRDDKTVVFTTHDLIEAYLIADIIIFFNLSPLKDYRKVQINVDKNSRNITDEYIFSDLYKIL